MGLSIPSVGAASQIPALASMIANGFNNPPDYHPWWFSPADAEALIQGLQQSDASVA